MQTVPCLQKFWFLAVRPQSTPWSHSTLALHPVNHPEATHYNYPIPPTTFVFIFCLLISLLLPSILDETKQKSPDQWVVAPLHTAVVQPSRPLQFSPYTPGILTGTCVLLETIGWFLAHRDQLGNAEPPAPCDCWVWLHSRRHGGGGCFWIQMSRDQTPPSSSNLLLIVAHFL